MVSQTCIPESSHCGVLLWLQTRAAYKKVMEENGVSDPNSLDKNYWIQRVGEVLNINPS